MQAPVGKTISLLKKEYPHAKYYLNFSSPIELLVAAIMSAQVRDEVVNATTKHLFKKYKTAEDFSKLDDNDIKSVTFYKNKAKHIREACKIISEKYNEKVPNTIEELTELPGIGRKTANAILINAFGVVAGIPCDIHVIRISYRLGWTKQKDTNKIEQDLMELVPKNDWKKLPHLMKNHGRAICKPLPDCNKCVINKICPKWGVRKNR